MDIVQTFTSETINRIKKKNIINGHNVINITFGHIPTV